MNCGDPTMENRFQVAKFLFEARKASSLFCLVQNGPGITWVACIALRERSKWSLWCERAFLEAFWTFMSHLGHTVPASCGHGIQKQIIVNHKTMLTRSRSSNSVPHQRTNLQQCHSANSWFAVALVNHTREGQWLDSAAAVRMTHSHTNKGS